METGNGLPAYDELDILFEDEENAGKKELEEYEIELEEIENALLDKDAR